MQYRLAILKYKDWLVKSASKKKKKNENSPLNTTIEKSWWLLCTKSRFTYNKANQLSKILFYQDISIFANAIYRNQHQTKSISALPLAYIHFFFFFFKTVNSTDLCFKISPKTCRQYKKLSSYSVLVLSYSWHCQICCHVWINIQNGYN